MQTATRITEIQESLIREMTRMATEHEAINLSQGYPDFAPPNELLDAATEAIRKGHNQYSPTWGHSALCEKLAEKYTDQLGWDVDPSLHVTVTCGVTEAINSAFLAVLNPGDQVIIVEPAHENFIPAAIFASAQPVSVPLQEPGYILDPSLIENAVTNRTKALLLNTPHNPTGRVFDAEEINGVIDVVLKHDLVLITDEIYDQILYDGRRHQSPGGLGPLRDRTITIGGFGKTFAITGWRLGYAIAPTALTAALRPVHDFLTICAPTPLQVAAIRALELSRSYYDNMLSEYHERRDVMMGILKGLGFVANNPEGSYYVLADYSRLPIAQSEWDSTRFAMWMLEKCRVAVLPGSIFFTLPGYGNGCVRLAFPKKLETLRVAGERMRKIRGAG